MHGYITVNIWSVGTYCKTHKNKATPDDIVTFRYRTFCEYRDFNFPRIFFHLQFHSIVSLASQFLSHVSDSVAICYSVMAKYEQQANQHEWIVVTNRFHSGSIFINNWLINIVSSHRSVFRRGWHYRLQLFFLLWLKLSHIRTTKSRLIKWFFAHSKRGFKGQHIVQDSSLLIDRSYCADAVKPLLSSDNWQSSKTLNWCFSFSISFKDHAQQLTQFWSSSRSSTQPHTKTLPRNSRSFGRTFSTITQYS